MNAQHRRWLITGAASGFGRALAEAVVAAGDAVVATARRPATLSDLAEHPSVTVLTLDVTDGAQVRDVVARAVASGGVDVLVNCAGHGLIGAFEELTDAEFRGVMETNLFGALAVTKAVLPHMRERGSGAIVQMSSQGGQVTFPGYGAYCAAKYALEAMSETLADEVGPLGIRVLIVEPGAFRTGLLGAAMHRSREIPAYAETAGATRAAAAAMDGTQPGDPRKLATAMLAALDRPDAPLHLALGADAVEAIRAAQDRRRADLEAWEEVSRGTALDEVGA
jgi:NAD(P)-dependent dehydrogenase (short-subunit alcohol dehydrogenase family)